jgi:hypothetical protein
VPHADQVRAGEVTELRLSAQKLHKQPYAELFACLEADRRVTSLDVSGNHLEDEGAKLVAKLIRANPTLTSIDVRHNEITTYDSTFLLRCLLTALQAGCELRPVGISGMVTRVAPSHLSQDNFTLQHLHMDERVPDSRGGGDVRVPIVLAGSLAAGGRQPVQLGEGEEEGSLSYGVMPPSL